MNVELLSTGVYRRRVLPWRHLLLGIVLGASVSNAIIDVGVAVHEVVCPR